jgi:hypothetical protein
MGLIMLVTVGVASIATERIARHVTAGTDSTDHFRRGAKMTGWSRPGATALDCANLELVSRVRFSLAWLATLAAWSTGCHKPGTADDPEKLAIAYAEAYERVDVAAMKRMIISPARLETMFTCPGISTPAGRTTQALQGLDVFAADKTAGAGMGVKSIRQTGGSHIASGEHFSDCSARVPFEYRGYHVEMLAAAAGPSEESLSLIRVNGRWWILAGH